MERFDGKRADGSWAVTVLALLALAAGGCGGATTTSDDDDDDGGEVGEDGDGGETCACTTDEDCANGLFCDGQERCAACVCVAGTPPECGDGVACTTDACNESMGACSSTPDHGLCGDFELCDPDSGCVASPECTEDLGCDDGLWCDGLETCDTVAGRCVPGTPPDCTDTWACTADGCNEDEDRCQAVNLDSVCDDGDACTPDRCDPTDAAADERGCVAGTSGCDDGNPCTDDQCDVTGGGCFHTYNTASCDDGDACTVGDTCGSGLCQPGAARDCGDGNVCTDDACNPSVGCNHAYNLDVCDDGSACTTDDRCDGSGRCIGTAPPSCDDGNPCTDDVCDAAGGCTHVDNTSPCDDGNACTEADTCGDGTCSGATVSCDDGNVCTDDSCVPATGCVFANNHAACDDGNPCTSGDACSGGACAPGAGLPVWYRDADSDAFGDAATTTCAASAPAGYVGDGTDCCDANRDARPDQTTYFAANYACGGGAPSYDYDCDGAEEPRWIATGGGCRSTGTSCAMTEGWDSSAPPACGASGRWVTGCTWIGVGCSVSSETRRQECR